MFDILDSQIVSDRIFYPRRTQVEPTTIINTGEGGTACYHANPHVGAGTILHFHGNGELASDYWEMLSPLFLNSGLNVCFMDYRGYGASDGTPNLVRQLADNVNLVNGLGIPPNRLIVYGRSLGSLFAVDLAAKFPQLAGLVVESAMANILEDWPLIEETRQLGKTNADLQTEVDALFDNRRKLEGYTGHLLVLHAENDIDLEPAHAVRLHSWCGSKDKRLVVFKDGDHSTILAENASTLTQELSELGDGLGLKGPSPS